MKKTIVLLLLLSVFCLSLLTACSSEWQEPQGIKVVYQLEGGTYKNSGNAVTQYYPLEKGSQLIYAPGSTTLEGEKPKYTVANGSLVLEGWYQTRIVEDGTVRYQDKWDFEKDKVTQNGVTLYARWKAPVTYRYVVKYVDQNSVEQTLGAYEVEQGQVFWDYSDYNQKIPNCTAFEGYYTDKACTVEWKEEDSNFVHPGGDTDYDVVLYVNYIVGDYELVSTAKQLTSALSRNKNVYLLNDVDMDGEYLGLVNYKGEFFGNGHTVSNFSIVYAGRGDYDYYMTTDYLGELDGTCVLQLSIFGSAVEAKVKDVTFDNVNAVVDFKASNDKIKKIYIAPFAVTAKDCTFEKVNVSNFFVQIVSAPNASCQVVQTQTESDFVLQNTNSTFTQCTVSFKN